jgi:hypothetical protein
MLMKKFKSVVSVGIGALLLISCSDHGTFNGLGRGTSDDTNTGSNRGDLCPLQSTSTQATVATPTFSPPSGAFSAPVAVSVQTSTAGTSIYCTLDGSDPTTASMLYTVPIAVSRTSTLKCRAYIDCDNKSEIATALYVIAGTAPAANCNHVGVEISLGVDNEDVLRVQNGVMDLIHVSGNRPEDPLVKVTYMDGTTTVYDRWVLDSNPTLTLVPPEQVAPGSGFIPASSVDIVVGRGSVLAQEPDRIVILDTDPNWSGYWFFFDYWYADSGG